MLYLPCRSFWKYRDLISQLCRRDIEGRYRGSLFGLLWSFVNPLLMLLVYTFVFGFVLRARFGMHASESKMEFSLILFAGLIIHQLMAECIIRSPTLIVSNPNYVKKVVFPLEVLSWSCILSALFHAGISLLVLLLFYLLLHGSLHWTLVFLPVLIFPFLIVLLGFSWILSSLGVYLRDIAQFMGFLVTVLLFLSPILYPLSSIPVVYRPFFYLNPLTFIVLQVREVVLWGNMPNWIGLAFYLGVALLVGWGGYFWFQKTRHGFADVL